MNVLKLPRARQSGEMEPARIGATGACMTAGAVIEWVEAAAAGDELGYATGRLPGWSKTPLVVQDLDTRKIVFAYFDRATGEYVIRRLKAAYTPPAEPVRIARVIAGSADDKARLLKVLRAEAKAGQPCSTNKTLAIKAGLRDGDRASYLLKLLVRDGAIRNEESGWWPGRCITIVATGDSTDVTAGRPR